MNFQRKNDIYRGCNFSSNMLQEYKRYIRQWQDNILKLNEALSKENAEEIEKYHILSENAYKKYVELSQVPMMNENATFGELNEAFISVLPKLFRKGNKKVIRECVNLIKGDKNLLAQSRFYNAVSKYTKDNGSPSDYINECLTLVDIDKKTLNQSKQRLAEILAKNEISVGDITLNEEKKNFYENCESLLTEKKTLANVSDRRRAIENVCKYMEKQSAIVSENKVKEVNERLSSKLASLNEAEMALVKDIIDCRQPQKEKRQKQIFETFKKECLSKIEQMLEDCATEDDKEGLLEIKKQIDEKNFTAETVIHDLTKLMEVHSLLFEK